MSGPEPPPGAAGLGLDAIADSPPSRVDPEVSAAVRDERDALEVERLQTENDLLRTEVLDRQQDRDERLRYAKRIYWLLVGWLGWMGGVVIAQGLRLRGFVLADGVLIALVGSTTATVIGIFLIVANYLFPRGPRRPPSPVDPAPAPHRGAGGSPLRTGGGPAT